MARDIRLMVVGSVVLVLALVGCGASTTRTVADELFVAVMLPHHRLGLDMIERSSGHVVDVEVRRLIFEMSDYHGHEVHDLESLATRWGLAEATDFPGHIAPARLDVLASLTGVAYDIGWLVAMIEHHEGAVEIASQALADGTDPDVRRLARQVLDVQVPEVEEMRDLVDRLCTEVSASC